MTGRNPGRAIQSPQERTDLRPAEHNGDLDRNARSRQGDQAYFSMNDAFARIIQDQIELTRLVRA
jgi:hypothetical protein